ncbi:putative cartilage matrix-associated protein [Salvelinus alpinus]|uniref:Unique cartilage matrix-associated protein n=1 Tax=Salvelinus namaycush TaxID=8040 RepID=A0A8U0PYS6_SALNM|nr:unique cartilage matrix-associated protein-like [Salvelinus namaycush]
MSWTHLVFLSLLATLLILTLSPGVRSASVRDGREGKAAEPKGSARRVFMPEADAANFFKKRSRRSAKHEAEVLAEQRVRLSADERRREYYDEQRNEFENYVEEERDEQDERTREKTEQWREFHYDGLYPRYPRGW